MIDQVMSIDLSKARHQLVTMPLVWVFGLVVIGWSAKPWIADQFGFVTAVAAAEEKREIRQEIAEVSGKLDKVATQQAAHITEFRVSTAFQLLRQTQEDLNVHLRENLDTQEWQVTRARLENRLRIANEYKTCVMEEKPNCNLLRNQLWQ